MVILTLTKDNKVMTGNTLVNILIYYKLQNKNIKKILSKRGTIIL